MPRRPEGPGSTSPGRASGEIPAGPGGDLSTVTRPRAERPSARGRSFVAVVVEGPDEGATLAIDLGASAPVQVGQSRACQLALRDREVSRRHLSLEVEGTLLRVTDLGSTNGTLVNGVRTREVLLSGGEQIRIGVTTLRVDAITEDACVPLPYAAAFGRLIGASVEMRRLYPLLERLAASDIPVIIEGETGTGKEVLAEAIHEKSARAAGPFVVFDCTAVPGALLEAALFGHERGAFTGAHEAKAGVFEEADGGTLLIDEIGDLDVQLQSRLLRAIERSEIRRLGGSRWTRIDVRIIAATRRDLEREIAAGRFRDDLFFRLAVGRVELPPLRRRHGDIRILAEHFFRELTAKRPSQPLAPETLERLEDYAWPGNVRELYNAVSARVALGDLARDLPASTRSASEAAAPPALRTAEDALVDSILAMDLPLSRARQTLVEEFERRYVERVVAQHDGNVTRAAQASGLALRYFQVLRARRR